LPTSMLSVALEDLFFDVISSAWSKKMFDVIHPQLKLAINLIENCDYRSP
jgi:hypothetical protein